MEKPTEEQCLIQFYITTSTSAGQPFPDRGTPSFVFVFQGLNYTHVHKVIHSKACFLCNNLAFTVNSRSLFTLFDSALNCGPGADVGSKLNVFLLASPPVLSCGAELLVFQMEG